MSAASGAIQHHSLDQNLVGTNIQAECHVNSSVIVKKRLINWRPSKACPPFVPHRTIRPRLSEVILPMLPRNHKVNSWRQLLVEVQQSEESASLGHCNFSTYLNTRNAVPLFAILPPTPLLQSSPPSLPRSTDF